VRYASGAPHPPSSVARHSHADRRRIPAQTDLRETRGGNRTRRPTAVIEPWISPPPDVVVYEFGARLDNASQAAAAAQILQARQLYNALIGVQSFTLSNEALQSSHPLKR
jgi:hypothetical protein